MWVSVPDIWSPIAGEVGVIFGGIFVIMRAWGVIVAWRCANGVRGGGALRRRRRGVEIAGGKVSLGPDKRGARAEWGDLGYSAGGWADRGM